MQTIRFRRMGNACIVLQGRKKKEKETEIRATTTEGEGSLSHCGFSLTYHLQHIALLGHNVQREHRWRLLDHRHNGAVGNASDRRVVHH